MTSAVHKDKHGNIAWRNEQGQLHREDGPAVERANYIYSVKEWWINGQRHRENGPAVEYSHGKKEWYLNGRRHRENGPAFEGFDGTKAWYINGQYHRENGPAIEGADGLIEYYLDGKTGPEFEQKVKENMARIQAQKDQEKLLSMLSQNQDISVKINKSSPKSSKKL